MNRVNLERNIIKYADDVMKLASCDSQLVEKSSQLHVSLCQMFGYVDTLFDEDPMISPPTFAYQEDAIFRIGWPAARIVAGRLCDMSPQEFEVNLNDEDSAIQLEKIAKSLQQDMSIWIEAISKQMGGAISESTAVQPSDGGGNWRRFTLQQLTKSYYISKDQAYKWTHGETKKPFIKRDPNSERGYLVLIDDPGAIKFKKKAK